jgi:hypothetical protein
MAGSARLSFDHGPRLAATIADVAAVDSGQPVIVLCDIRRLYGDQPPKFKQYFMELAPGGPVIFRKLFFISRHRTPLPEQILSANVRPFANRREAMRFVSSGVYAPGGAREWAGMSILSCKTQFGTMEIAAWRRDVSLLMHYFDVQRKRREARTPGAR